MRNAILLHPPIWPAALGRWSLMGEILYLCAVWMDAIDYL